MYKRKAILLTYADVIAHREEASEDRTLGRMKLPLT
jgi:hypothetical protein